uniref:Tip attachment protein J domain-containing protein n=1 Tax=Caulobacter phage BL57 TaxID=3348355 RepID=A0AB74UMH1_9VIRU
MSESDLPSAIDLTYMNIDDDYNPSTAKSKRISAPVATMLSRQQVKTECNLVMDATEAKNRVNVMLYTQWDERTQHNTALPWRYAHLDASDLISVTMEDGRNYFDRIGSIEFGADFSSRLETYGTDSGAYLSEKVGDGGGAGRPTVVNAPKPVVGFIMNTRCCVTPTTAAATIPTGIAPLAPARPVSSSAARSTSPPTARTMSTSTRRPSRPNGAR